MEQLIDHWIDDSARIEPATDALPDPEAQPKDMSAHAVLQSIHQMFAADAVEKGLDLRLRLGPQDRPVAAFALMRVVNNLVANALRYTQSGAVLIACSASDEGLRIEVHDTGPGLSADDFEHARMRHVRLGGPADYETEGTGLGLAIADKIALQEGWSLKHVAWRKTGTGIALHIPQKAPIPAL